jgi:hypothetical protein
MSTQNPYSMMVNQQQDTGLVQVAIEGKTSNFKDFADFYKGMHEEFDLHDFAEPFAFTGEGVVATFAKVNRYGVVVGHGYCTITVAFSENLRDFFANLLARMAYVHFEKIPITVDCDDEKTLRRVWQEMKARDMAIAAKNALQQALLTEIMALPLLTLDFNNKILTEPETLPKQIEQKDHAPREKTKKTSQQAPSTIQVQTTPTQLTAPIANTISSPFSLKIEPTAPPMEVTPIAPPMDVKPTAPPMDPPSTKPLINNVAAALTNNNNEKLSNDRALPNNNNVLPNDRVAAVRQLLLNDLPNNRNNSQGAAPAA